MPNVEDPQPEAEGRRRFRLRFRVNTIWIGLILVAILAVAYTVGYLIHNANATRAVAIFAIGVVSFLGMLSLGHQGGRYRSFESSEVRVAVTTAFVLVYFAVLGIFLFSSNQVSDFGRQLVGNLTSLYAVVVGFYFASSAVVEYGKTRSGRRSSRDGTRDADPTARDAPAPEPDPPADAGPPAADAGPPATAAASLEAEVRALRELVMILMAERDARSRQEGQRTEEESAGVR